MSIPSQLKIGGHTVEVVFQEWASNRLGAADLTPNKLYINSTLPTQQQESTLLHEVLEYINDSCDLGLTHIQIATLETMLYQVLKDNNLW